MGKSALIDQVERYARETLTPEENVLTLAHDFKHVDRVRNTALLIAGAEQYPDMEMVEIAALLHDIGLGHMSEGLERQQHGPVGAEITRNYLAENSDLPAEKRELIADAVHWHSLHPVLVAEYLERIGDRGRLIEIVRDADVMDSLGALGILRGLTSRYNLPDYDPSNIKGGQWNLSPAESRTAYDGNTNASPSSYIVTMIDQLNWQVHYYHNLHTDAARKMAAPLIEYMNGFILQLEKEILHQERTNRETF